MNQSNLSNANTKENCLTPSESAVIECLLYFDTFTYPLTLDEIYKFCTVKCESTFTLKSTLNALLNKNLIKQKELFYFVNDDDSIVERRIKGNKKAQQVMPKAIKYGQFIAQFPFVETVFISGSLSKNYFDENGDVDFFIITKSQRLWLCRSLLVGFKKVFLLNSRKYFCVNYFVGSDSLSIPDKNIFTATEIASLIPINNFNGYANFIEHNQWIYKNLPNFNLNKEINAPNLNETRIKILGEKLMGNSLGDFADKQLFKLTLSIWQKKFKHFNKTDFDLNMRSRKNVSKHHPSGFQQKVLNSWASNKENFCKKHQIHFTTL